MRSINWLIVLEGLGVPSLLKADKLSISGPVRFSDGVKIVGDVSFLNESGETKWIAGGTYQDEQIVLLSIIEALFC